MLKPDFKQIDLESDKLLNSSNKTFLSDLDCKIINEIVNINPKIRIVVSDENDDFLIKITSGNKQKISFVVNKIEQIDFELIKVVNEIWTNQFWNLKINNDENKNRLILSGVNAKLINLKYKLIIESINVQNTKNIVILLKESMKLLRGLDHNLKSKQKPWIKWMNDESIEKLNNGECVFTIEGTTFDDRENSLYKGLSFRIEDKTNSLKSGVVCVHTYISSSEFNQLNILLKLWDVDVNNQTLFQEFENFASQDWVKISKFDSGYYINEWLSYKQKYNNDFNNIVYRIKSAFANIKIDFVDGICKVKNLIENNPFELLIPIRWFSDNNIDYYPSSSSSGVPVVENLLRFIQNENGQNLIQVQNLKQIEIIGSNTILYKFDNHLVDSYVVYKHQIPFWSDWILMNSKDEYGIWDLHRQLSTLITDYTTDFYQGVIKYKSQRSPAIKQINYMGNKIEIALYKNEKEDECFDLEDIINKNNLNTDVKNKIRTIINNYKDACNQ